MLGQLRNELILAADLQRVVGQPLGADRRGALGAHVSSTKGACAVRRIDQNVVGQAHELAVQAVVEHSRQLLGSVVARQIRTAHVAEKQRVPGQNRPGLRGFLAVDDHQADALRRMTGSFQHADAESAHGQLKAVSHGHVGKLCASAGSDVDFRTGSSGELLVSGDKIGVKVSLEDVPNGDALCVRGIQVEVNVTLGIDHHPLALRRQQVGGVRQTAQIKLFKMHALPSPACKEILEEVGQQCQRRKRAD